MVTEENITYSASRVGEHAEEWFKEENRDTQWIKSV
jgi:hypothetical protein